MYLCVCVCVTETTHIHLAVAPRQVEQDAHSEFSKRLQFVHWKLLESCLVGLSSLSGVTLL